MRRKRRENDEVEELQTTPSAPEAVRPQTVTFAQKLTCTINEACEMTGLGRTKLYELIGDGHLATTTVGRRRLVVIRSLLSLLEFEHFGMTVCDSTASNSSLIVFRQALIFMTRPSSFIRSSSSAHQRIIRTRSCQNSAAWV